MNWQDKPIPGWILAISLFVIPIICLILFILLAFFVLDFIIYLKEFIDNQPIHILIVIFIINIYLLVELHALKSKLKRRKHETATKKH